MTARKLHSLDIDTKTLVCHRLRSVRTGMCKENVELSKQLRELQEKLEEVEAKLARESQELAEVQERAARGQQEAERERHRAESLEAELRTVRLEAEVDKLREIEAIRTQFDGERERLNTARECDATRFDEWRIRMETEKRRLEEQLRDRDSTVDTKTELMVMESEGGEHYEPEGIIDPSLPIEPVESAVKILVVGAHPLVLVYLGHMGKQVNLCIPCLICWRYKHK